MKITEIRTIEGMRMFWMNIKRSLVIEVADEKKSIDVIYTVTNHGIDLEPPYIDYKKNGISKDLANSILYYMDIGGDKSVSEVLSRVGLKIDNFIINGIDVNKEYYPTDNGEGIQAVGFEVVILRDKFTISDIWFEKEVEFIYNRQIKVRMVPDYFFNFVTGVHSIDTTWDKIHSISLLRTHNIDGVDVEHLIEDKSVIVDNKVFQNDAIQNFLLGYFFGCHWDDNVFFDQSHQERTNFSEIYDEFCLALNISKI